jgi:hypothetical protein
VALEDPLLGVTIVEPGEIRAGHRIAILSQTFRALELLHRLPVADALSGEVKELATRRLAPYPGE